MAIGRILILKGPTDQRRFGADAGLHRGAHTWRWEMRNGNGSRWVTRGYYTDAEIGLFICARPVCRYCPIDR